jgi:hypothetical protein
VVCGSSAEPAGPQEAASTSSPPAPADPSTSDSDDCQHEGSSQQAIQGSIKEPAQLATGYLRHSIVPHTYRRHFPLRFKSHLSHDIVLLCLKCHQVCLNHYPDGSSFNTLSTDTSAGYQDMSGAAPAPFTSRSVRPTTSSVSSGWHRCTKHPCHRYG